MDRRTPSRSRGLTAYQAFELLNGKIDYPNVGYSGYGDRCLWGRASCLSRRRRSSGNR